MKDEDKKAAVRKALVEICSTEACASVSELVSATRLPERDVRQALKGDQRIHTSTRGGRLTATPKDSDGRVLVCGQWCGERI